MKTDELGRYQLDGFPAGSYTLGLRFFEDRHPEIFDKYIEPYDWRSLVLTEGASVEVDMSLKPVAYVKARFIDGDSNEVINGEHIWRIPAGERKLSLNQISPPEGYSQNSDSRRVDVEAGKTELIDVKFTRKPEFEAKSASVSGFILNEASEPLVGAEVIANLSGTSGSNLEFGVSDSSGAFEVTFDLRGLDEIGNVRLFAVKDEFVSIEVKEWLLGETNAVVVLSDRSATSLQGKIVDEAGKPITGAIVQLSGDLPRNWAARYQMVTGRDGSYRFDNLMPAGEEIDISVSCGGYGTRRSYGHQIVVGQQHHVDAIVLPKADQSVAGVVLDENGKPAAGVKVYAHGYLQQHSGDREKSPLNAVTNKDGEFKIEGLVDRWLNLSTKGCPTDSGRKVTQRVRAGQQDLILDRSVTHYSNIRGTAVDLTGQPMPELTIEKWYHAEPVDVNAKGKVKVFLFQAMDRSLMWSSNTLPLHEKLVKENPELDIFIIHTTWPQREVDEVLANQFPDFKTRFALEAADQPIQAVFKAARLPHLVVDENGIIVMQTDRAKAAIRKAKQLVD